MYEHGHLIREVAARFDMSEAMILARIREADGSTRPNSHNGHTSKGPIEVYELEQEPISFKALAEQTGLAIHLLMRWAARGKIPAHYIEGKWVVYADEIAQVDMVALKAAKRTVHVNNKPKCASCGIVLRGKFALCRLCMRWCIYRPGGKDHGGEWVQRKIRRDRVAIA